MQRHKLPTNATTYTSQQSRSHLTTLQLLSSNPTNKISSTDGGDAPPRPPPPSGGGQYGSLAPPRPPPPDTDDEADNMFEHAPTPSQGPIMVRRNVKPARLSQSPCHNLSQSPCHRVAKKNCFHLRWRPTSCTRKCASGAARTMTSSPLPRRWLCSWQNCHNWSRYAVVVSFLC